MLIDLHSLATTTPNIRAEIQASDEPTWFLAKQSMKDWHKFKPELFKKQPYCPPGCEN